MKKIASLVLLLSACLQSIAQSCCDAPREWPLLALNEDFKSAHADPLPFNYAPAKGSMITFNTLDTKTGRAFYVPSDQPTNNVVILFHEWWGLNDYIIQEAEHWQELLGNVDVYAVDLYDGRVAKDQAEASKLSGGLDKKRAETIVKGLLAHVKPDRQIATIGWCMGGTWSFTAAVLAGDRARACVMYYGFPEKEEKKIKPLKADVLYIYGTKDNFITNAQVTEFGEKVKATGKEFKMHSFDAVHAFANPSNPNHDKLATKQAEQLTVKFVQERLQLE